MLAKGASSNTIEKITLKFSIFLGIIALLACTGFLAVFMIIKTHDDSAATINIAGRQRMLSHRIESLAHQFNNQLLAGNDKKSQGDI